MTFLGKGDKRRTVPIHPTLKRVLSVAPAVGQITTQELKSGPVLWTQGHGGHYCGQGGSFNRLLHPLTDEGFHIFRKTVATSLSRNGIEDTMIFKILGWEAPNMYGKHYYAPNGADMHRAILKLYADSPLKESA
jgi:integrase